MALKKPSELFENNGNDSSRESEGENRQEEVKVNRRVVSPKELFGEIVEEEVVVEETPVEEVVEVKAEETKEDITELVQEKIGQQTEAIQEKLKEKFDEYSEKFEDRTKKYYQNLTNQFNSVKENLIKKVSNLEVDILRNEHHLRNNNVDVDEIRQDINETIQRIKSEIIEDVGVLQEPASNVTTDPLTPLDQNFVTFDHLNDHYRLFLNRIQQQLTTLGGGGEYRLQYLDDIVGIATNASAYDGKYLRYNHSLKKFEFVTVSGGAGSQTLDQTLALGNSSNAGMTVGISTFNNVVVGGSNTALVVNGNARITGILTIGTGSITLNGTNDSIRIGTGLTITSAGNANYSGVITATSFVGSGASLTGLTGASANTYGNATTVPQIVIDSNGRITSISNVSISAGGGGGTGINVRDNGSVIGFAGTVDFGAGIDATAISSGITTVFVSYAPVAGIATTATSAYNLYGTPNLNVGVLTATSLNGSGINLTGIVTSIVAGAGITINQSTGRIIITSIGGTVGTYATVGYVDQQISTLIGGAPAILDTLNELALALNDDANFASSIAATLSNKLDLTGGTISGSLQVLGGFVGNLTGTASNATVAGYAKTAGIATVSGYATNAGVATYAVNAGVATYAPSAGIATYTPLAGLSTYATNSGVSTYAVNAGVATNAYTAGIATNSQYAFVAGVSTNAFVAGIATYATSAGVATNAYNAGIATYATSTGVATNAYNAGIATYATVAGVATNAFTAGIATNAQFATVATNAYNAGVATVAVNAYSSGIATNAFTAGVSTNAFNAGIATYAVTAGVATNAYNAGIATVATNAYNAGIATVATNAYNAGVATVAINAYNSGIATYAITAGVATYSASAGVATNAYIAGIATVAQGLTGTPNLNVGIVTATSYNGSGSNLTGLTGASANTYGNATTVPQIVVDGNGRITSIANVLISGGGGGGGTGVNVKNLGSVVGFAGTIDFGTGLTVTPVSAGVVTVTASGGGSGQYSSVAGIATYATTAGVSTNAYNAGIATYAVTAGVSTNAFNAGIATYATSTGVATNAYNAGIATYATVAGVATNAFNAGIATVATNAYNAGVATNAYNAGIATYAVTAGISTSVIGGIASVTALTVSGVSTFSNNVRVSGIITTNTISVSDNGSINGSLLIDNVSNAYTDLIWRRSDTGANGPSIRGIFDVLYIDAPNNGYITLGGSTANAFYNGGNVHLNLNNSGTTTLFNELGVVGTTTSTQLSVSGVSTFSNTVNFNTNTVNFGTQCSISTSGNDLNIYAYNDVYIRGAFGGTKITSQQGANLVFVDSVAGDVSLYYQTGPGSSGSSKRLQTLGTGVTVTGTTFTTNLSVSGNASISGNVTATSFVGDGSQLTGVVGSANTSNIRTNSLNVSGVSTFAGITTFTGENLFTKQFNVSGVSTFNSNVTINGTASATSFSGSGSNLTGLTGASANTYGNASAVPQIVVDSNGRITSITNVAISGGGGGGGTGVNVKSVGSVVGFAGTIDFGLGLSVTPVSAGIVTINNAYAATAGIATDVIGGISSVTALNVSGLSTFAGITTVTGPNLFTKQLNVSGVSTFNSSLKIVDSIFTGTYDPSRIQFRTGEVVIDSVSHTLRFQPSTTADYGSILFFSRTGATAGSLIFRNSAILDFDLNGSINISGVSTFAGITTVTGQTLFAKQVNVSGVATVSRLVSAGASLTSPLIVGLTTATYGIRFAASPGAEQYVHNIGPSYIIGYDAAGGYQNDAYLQFSPVNSNYILKNVGIGTTNPSSGYDLTVGKSSLLGQVSNSLKVHGYAEINGLIIKGNSTTGSAPYYGDNVIITQNPAGTFTGSQNVAIGANSFTKPGAASDTVAIGYNALNSVGNNNTISTYNGNIGVGAYAGQSCTSALYNTLVGWSAGRDFTVANYNTFIGQQAGRYITTGQSNVIIGSYDGNQNGLDIRTSSNNVVLSDGQGNIRQYINSSGNVGLGTTNPTSTLTVGGATSTRDLYVSGVSTFSGTVNFNSANISGDLTFANANGDIYLKDNGVINFGDDNDLRIFHNGSVSVIRDGGTGGLLIDSDNEIKLAKNGTGSDTLAIFTPDGSVELYYDNSKKFETTGAGVTVTGTIFTNQLSVSGISSFTGAVSCASTVSFGTTAYFGASNEIVLNNKFKVYTDTSNTYLKNFDTNTGGDLYIQSDVTLIQKYDGTETIARFTEGAGVELNYLGQNRLTTIEDGVIVGSNAAGVAHIPNELRIGTVGANQSNASIMIANSSGVGLGTTNPTGRLTVKGTSVLDNLTVSGVSTFTNGPIFVGTANSTGTASQTLQVTGGAYVSGRLGIGTTNPVATVQVGTAATQSVVISGVGSVGVGTINPVSSFQVEQYAIENFTGSFTASPGVASNIDAFTISVTDFKAVEYTLHFAYATNIQAQKVLVMQNGTTAYAQEYAIMSEPNLIVSIGATVSSGVCYLQATPEAGISGVTTYRLVRSGML